MQLKLRNRSNMLRRLSLPLTVLIVASVATLKSAHAELPDELFVAGDRCQSCHNGLVTSAGRDVSIGLDWSASMMAQAARDPYWQAAVRREALDHPKAQAAIEHECSTCHMPMAHYPAKLAGGQGEVFSHLPIAGGPSGRVHALAADGVSCSVCHQIGAAKLGEKASFTGGFVIDAQTPLVQRSVFGPYEIKAGASTVMQSATGFVPQQSQHLQGSEFCATCHTLYTHALGPDGEVVGELPEQVPYLEWRHSVFQGKRACQSCHMPQLEAEHAISSVLPTPRPRFSQHSFRGGNFFMLGILARHSAELGVAAQSRELATTRRATLRQLGHNTARLRVTLRDRTDRELRVKVQVRNLAGHKLPTAYPSRRVWLEVVAQSDSGRILFASGRLNKNASIVGNDNDLNADRYEPHYELIEAESQVQIYEPILKTPAGEVTTGLLMATGYIKDNRLLPRGFDKKTADADIAVHGGAASDEDFKGGSDTLEYAIPVAGADGSIRVRVRLWYQPIGFRWARNLSPYEAPEPQRFERLYAANAEESATVLAREELQVPLHQQPAPRAAPQEDAPTQ